MLEADQALADEREEEIALLGVSLVDLREGRRKFPLGRHDEPVTRFRGNSAPIGSPYCRSASAFSTRLVRGDRRDRRRRGR